MDLEKLYLLYLRNRQNFILSNTVDPISANTPVMEAYAICLAMDKDKDVLSLKAFSGYVEPANTTGYRR